MPCTEVPLISTISSPEFDQKVEIFEFIKCIKSKKYSERVAWLTRLQGAIIRRLPRREYSLYENTHIAFWRVTSAHNAESQRFHAVSLEESYDFLRWAAGACENSNKKFNAIQYSRSAFEASNKVRIMKK